MAIQAGKAKTFMSRLYRDEAAGAGADEGIELVCPEEKEIERVMSLPRPALRMVIAQPLTSGLVMNLHTELESRRKIGSWTKYLLKTIAQSKTTLLLLMMNKPQKIALC